MADAWWSNAHYVLLSIALPILITIVVTVKAKLIDRVDKKLVNLPQKDYWLSSERISETKKSIQSWLSLLGIGFQVFFLAVSFMVYRANLQSPAQLNEKLFLLVLFFFLLFLAAWVFRFWRYFQSTAH